MFFFQTAVVPLCAEVAVARQAAAVGIQRQADEVGIGRLVQMACAPSEPSRLADAFFQHAVQHEVAPARAFAEGFVARGRADEAAAQAVRRAQCARRVEHAVYLAEAVGQQLGGKLRLRGGLFAHHVDGAARLAVCLRQPGRAAYHFDVVVHRHVGARHRVALRAAEAEAAGRADLRGDAAFFQLFDKIAARHKMRAAARLEHINAGGGFQRVFQPRDALVGDLVFGDHGYRLRDFARRQNQAGGGAQHGHAVAVAVFRAQAAAFAAYGNLRRRFPLYHVIRPHGGGQSVKTQGERGGAQGGMFRFHRRCSLWLAVENQASGRIQAV